MEQPSVREIQIVKLSKENFNASTLDQFVRHQEVKECWRNIEGEWKLVRNEFTEDWSLADCRQIACSICKNLEESIVGFGAFMGDRLVGYITISKEFSGTKKQYLELLEFQVSESFRNQGIGRKLFECACEAARDRKAEKLYISAHSSKESQAAYRKLGCKLVEEVNPINVAKEPFDVQMEYVLSNNKRE